MITVLRILLEGGYETVEAAALKWEAAAHELAETKQACRLDGSLLDGPTAEETEAVKRLEHKASELKSAAGLALARRYWLARDRAEEQLRARLQWLGQL